MANFNWGYMAGSGNWFGVTTLDTSWMTTIDQNQQKGINATDGSTHAPTGVITIGGSGIAMTGPFSMASTVAFGAAAVTTFASGSTTTFANGSLISFGSTTNVDFNGDMTLSEYPLLDSPKIVYKNGLNLLGCMTVAGGTHVFGTTVVGDLAAMMTTRIDTLIVLPTIAVRKLSSGTPKVYIELPGLINGATLDTVGVFTVGGGAAPTGAHATMFVARQLLHNGNVAGTIDTLCATVDDAHLASGTWTTDVLVTSMTMTANNVIDLQNYRYWVCITCPDSSDATTGLFVDNVRAKYLVSDIRP